MERKTKFLKGSARAAGPRPRRPDLLPRGHSVSIIGAGRLGTALGLALKAKGHEIKLVVTHRPSTARRAAKVFGPRTLALSVIQLSKLSASHDRLNRCSLILIATPDENILPAVELLAGILKPSSARRTALHTSGALSSDVLDPLRSAGFAAGSLHPLVSISDARAGAESLTRAFFSVEGDPAAVRTAQALVRNLGGQTFTIDPGTKALYHAAAVTAAPHMTALFDIAIEMLGRCGLPANRARQVLLPLAESTMANLATQDPARALTGTFKRGDVSTVRKHLATLKAANLPQALAAYVLLGQRSIALSRKDKANRAALDQIARLLSDVVKSSHRQ